MTHTAFELAEEYAGEYTHDDKERELAEPVAVFQGAVLALPPDGRSYDVAAKLEAGEGTIVVQDGNTVLVEMLRSCPALVEVPVPAGWVAGDDVDDWTVAMMQDELGRLEIPRSGTRPVLLARIRAARTILASGDDVAPGTLADAVAAAIAADHTDEEA